jgi:hypothetical protein
MRKPTYFKIFTIIFSGILIISCVPQPEIDSKGFETSPLIETPQETLMSTPSIETPAPRRTQKPKGTPRQDQQNNTGPHPGQVFPTSSFVPEDANFNLILGRPTADSITASLFSKSDQQVTLSYGEMSGDFTSEIGPISLKANTPVQIEISNLEPDREYFYSINDGVEHTFHTQRSPGSTFTFTIDADPHNRDENFNGQLYDVTLQNILADQPDFHIDLGDTFMTEKVQAKTYAEAESTFTDMRPYFGLIGADTPLFLVNGNHEGELGWLQEDGRGDELPVWATHLRELYYPNPIPNGFYTGANTIDPVLGKSRDGYYAWTWGDALFVVLDPFWYTGSKPSPDESNSNWGWTLGREQYDWLKTTLEGSQAKYKFIFIHHLVGGISKDARGGIEAASFFEWGGNNVDGSYGFDQYRPGWGEPIHELLVDNHVSAVFHGHDHVFVKQELDGIIYQECPQPSMARYDNTQLAREYGYDSGVVFGSSGHLRVIVSPAKITVDYVRSYLSQDENSDRRNGAVTSSYSIQGK